MKKKNQYHFLNLNDLISFFVEQHYKDKSILVIMDCKEAFTSIPKLNILKRDNYSAFLLAFLNDIAIIEFGSLSEIKDFVYGFPITVNINYLIFDKGYLIPVKKGKIDE